MIEKKEIQHLAGLARIELTGEEEAALAKEASAILDYIGQLKDLDIANIEPMARAKQAYNAFREDEAVESDPETVLRLNKAFPRGQDGYLRVKKVFDHE